MRRGDKALSFRPVTEVDRQILPIFGAHPLSNVFNKAPILLIEGEDDERVWQQAVRSASGRIRLFPCVVDGVDHFSEFESEVNDIIEAVYDDATAYSLRDRDTHPEAINDVGHVQRMRLACRAAENLLLSDEVLALAGFDWTEMQTRVRGWAAANPGHQYHEVMQAFLDSGLERKSFDLKRIRNILIGLVSNKPWEVLVGQAIAAFSAATVVPKQSGGLVDFLGESVCRRILQLQV
jgi:hypothetical protein